MSYDPNFDPTFFQSDPYEEYLALMDIGYGPEGRWDPYGQYGYANQIPEQLYDMYKPRSDSAANIMVNRAMGGADGWENFSNDVYLQADPLVQPFLAEILANNDNDMIAAVNDWNDGENQAELRERVGRTAWDHIGANADWATRNRINTAEDGEAKDDIAIDYLNKGLENLLAQGSPSVARNAGYQEALLQRYGARPITGGQLPTQGGPGFPQAAGGEGAGGGGTSMFGSGGNELEQLEAMYGGMAEEDPEGWQAVLDFGRWVESNRARQEADWGDNVTRRGREYGRRRRERKNDPDSVNSVIQRIEKRKRDRVEDNETWGSRAGGWLDRNIPSRRMFRDMASRMPWS